MSRPPQAVIVSPRLSPPAAVVLGPIGLGLAMLLMAGGWLLWGGAPGPGSLLGLLHLGFVGGLLPIALGAGLQLSAATTGRRPSHTRTVLPAALSLPIGGALVALGFALPLAPLVPLGGAVVLCDLALLALATVRGALAARPFAPLHLGLAIGVVSFFAVAFLGTAMGLARLGYWPGMLSVLPWHIAAALGTGFSALLVGVSWQLLPMFAQVPQQPRWFGHVEVSAAAAASLLGALLRAMGEPLSTAALPLALVLTVWVLALVRQASRRRGYGRLRLTHVAAPLAMVQIAVSSWLLVLGRPGQALLLAGAGGFALAEIGFLERILPFLVHLARLGRGTVKKLDEILPQQGGIPLVLAYEAALLLWLFGLPFFARVVGLSLMFLSARLLRGLLALRVT